MEIQLKLPLELSSVLEREGEVTDSLGDIQI